VKLALAASQFLCLLSLAVSTPTKYRLTLLYLLSVIPATLLFRAESAWLHSWYLLLVGPVALLRFGAALEIAHRQTWGFRYWSRLIGTCFLLAGLLASLAWVQAAPGDALQSGVELRRLLQLWCGSYYMVLELFWLTQGGGVYRRADRVALAFGGLCLNHAVVSFLGGLGLFKGLGQWEGVQIVSWLADGLCYVFLAMAFASGLRFVQTDLRASPLAPGFRSVAARSHAADL